MNGNERLVLTKHLEMFLKRNTNCKDTGKTDGPHSIVAIVNPKKKSRGSR